jgi:hypothetical protein
VTAAETGTRGSRPGELHRRRVLLLAESAGLAAVLGHLLDPADRLSRIGSLRELAETRALEQTDVVVLDVAAEDRAAAVGQIRRRYLGPLVVLAARGENVGGLRLDDAATLLARPFSADDLGAALATPGRPGDPRPRWISEPAPPTERLRSPTGSPAPAPARPGTGPATAAGPAAAAGSATGDPAAAADDGGAAAASRRAAELKAAARQAPVRAAAAAAPGQVGLVERVQRLLIGLTEGWRARRRVRVAGFSVFALVAFTVAFALAAQGHCGPGCDAFGTGFSPAPTIAPSESRADATTGPKLTTSTTAPAGSPGTGAFRGISGGRVGASSTTRRATTTTRKPVATTRPATTRPATTRTTSPTTAPTTTVTTLPTTTTT